MLGHRIISNLRRIAVVDAVDDRTVVGRSSIYDVAVIKHSKHKTIPGEQVAPVAICVRHLDDRNFGLFSGFICRDFHAIIVDRPPLFRRKVNRDTVLSPQLCLLILRTIRTAADIHVLALREGDIHLAGCESDIYTTVHPLPARRIIRQQAQRKHIVVKVYREL